MAVVPFSLFFKGIGLYGPGRITFDIVIEENHNFDSVITSHPIEDGSEASDHIQNLPLTGDITGLISNYSLFAGPFVTNRAEDVFNALEALYTSRVLFKMTTILKVYDNVAIASMPVRRDEDTGDALLFAISFKQVKVVHLQEVALEVGVSVDNLQLNLNRQVSPVYDASVSVPGVPV